MKILFLDQSGKLGGAELSLLDVATPYRDCCLVGLFADGTFRQALEQRQIPVQVLTNQSLTVRKESGLLHSVVSLRQLLPLIAKVAYLSQSYDVIYTNTQKALVVGAIASLFSRRPLVHHLRDILSTDHFSQTNLRIVTTLANRLATHVICNSQATREAFIAAGGRANLAQVIYNGFNPDTYQNLASPRVELRRELGLSDRFVIGHFSRLSPWKGQHILIEALTYCPDSVVALLVGDALFGEQDYVEKLQQQITQLGLENRVRFLGFRSDIPDLMAACDLVAHSSTAPEPFGRVIVEAMLCGTPVIAAQAGGTLELVKHGVTGWLVPASEPLKLAEIINQCYGDREQTQQITHRAQHDAMQRFHLDKTHQQIAQLLDQVTVAR